LENRDNMLENTAVFGELENKKVRLSIPADDERLVAAMENEMPLELGERAKESKAGSGRTMNLYPIGVESDISAALAILNPGDDEVAKKQIARICRSIAPQLEILRLRSQVAKRERMADAVRRLSDSLRDIDADDFWLHLTQNAAEMMRAERASLLILDEKSGKLDIKTIIGAKHEVPENSDIGRRVARIVLARKGPVVIS